VKNEQAFKVCSLPQMNLSKDNERIVFAHTPRFANQNLADRVRREGI
jgi:hypothetical protein